nr:MAG TPA: hypothetical protein [Caudoviricetes sp.]DAV60547.1 MAG TPA: hypothetical protein [Caudoviricetes sp.]
MFLLHYHRIMYIVACSWNIGKGYRRNMITSSGDLLMRVIYQQEHFIHIRPDAVKM